MFYYAELNVDNIVQSVKTVKGEIQKPNHIKLNTYDTDLMHRKYDKKTQTFSDEKFLPDMAEIQRTEFEGLKFQQAQLLLDNADKEKKIRDLSNMASDLLLTMARNGIK